MFNSPYVGIVTLDSLCVDFELNENLLTSSFSPNKIHSVAHRLNQDF